MKDAKVAKDFSVADMPFEQQKEVARTAARIKEEWNLDLINIRDIAFPSKDSNTFMWANGGKVETNNKYWSAQNYGKTTSVTYDNNVGIRECYEIALQRKKKWLDNLTSSSDGSSWYKKEIPKAKKRYNELKALIDTGLDRHNVFLSRETMLRDCFTHELGHTQCTTKYLAD